MQAQNLFHMSAGIPGMGNLGMHFNDQQQLQDLWGVNIGTPFGSLGFGHQLQDLGFRSRMKSLGRKVRSGMNGM